MTNADKIRSMTDEELAEFFDKYFEDICEIAESCSSCFLNLGVGMGCVIASEWLQQEVEE